MNHADEPMKEIKRPYILASSGRVKKAIAKAKRITEMMKANPHKRASPDP